MALGRCISTSADTFRDRIFGRRHLHSTAAELPGGFADLFSPEALDDVLAAGLRTSSIRLLRDNVEAPVTRGAVAEEGDTPGAAPFVSTDTVRSALASGHTLIIRSLQRIHPPLRRFAHELSAELGHPVRINAFVTPPHSQGVDLHYDIEDVLVLQITGNKRWELRTQPFTDPLPRHAWFDSTDRRRNELRAESEPLAELVLREGDSLYFPRGTFHSPRTQEDLSMHLTIAIPPVTRHDLLTELVSQAVGDDAWLRGTVSLDALEDDAELARTVLAEAAERLAASAKTADPADVLWAVRKAAFKSVVPEPVSVLPGSAAAAPYRLRDGAVFRVTEEKDGTALLTTGTHSARLPKAVAPALRSLRRGPDLDFGALVKALGVQDATEVSQALVSIGLVAPVGPRERAQDRDHDGDGDRDDEAAA
ncbi:MULTISPECIES: JmjC domain-containing protein [unclassified Streptomyces]|uniref:JmjC domain-containing protein n=1 Tax=unclassified Streptomyces TaxID=2593676 RepID=UPI002E2A3A04|nr:cupin domain-containing protein [Streptomyces sp. NBC_01439]